MTAHDQEIVSTRSEAKTMGLRSYFTGKACRNGHISKRYVDGGCVQCLIERRAANPEMQRRASLKWKRANKEKVLASVLAWRAANPERVRELDRKRRADNPEKYKERDRIRRAADPEKFRARDRKRYAADPEKRKEPTRRWLADPENREKNVIRCRERYWSDPEGSRLAAKAWREANPEKSRLAARLAEHRRRTTEGTFTRADIRRIMKDQRCRCAYCRTSIKKGFHIDHILPITKGGANWPRNLQLTCGSCNNRKYNKLPEDFAQELGLLL